MKTFNFLIFAFILFNFTNANAENPNHFLTDKSFVRVRVFKNLSDAEAQLFKSKYFKLSRTVDVFVKGENIFDIVEKIKMRDYLAGVISKEMSLNWPMEALKAQAVVARSYALAKMNERQYQNYDVENDQMDQVFSWTQSSKAYQAVDETQDLVLVYHHQPKIVKAYYHSDCGGQTVPASLVWPGAFDSGTAQDSFCLMRKKNKWQFKVPRDSDFENQAIKKYRSKILFIASVSIQKIREKFGFNKIKNAPLEIVVNENEIIFKGQGYGHGAGLCQWGSRDLALSGYGFKGILQHYYPKVQMLNLNSINSKNNLTEYKINQTIKGNQLTYN